MNSVVNEAGRRIPLHLQESVQKEIERLLHEKHIEKVRTANDIMFIQLTVIIVKDKSVKIALDARE